MWTCQALQGDGSPCNFSNEDVDAMCIRCSSLRTTPKDDHDPHNSLGNFLHSAKEVASHYAPVAQKAATMAREKASDFAEQSRVATKTGLHIVAIMLFCGLLLAVSMALPVALHWPMRLTINARSDATETLEAKEDARLPGAQSERTHSYQGEEYSAVIVPSELNGPDRMRLTMNALFAGPMIITGSPVSLFGHGAGDGQSLQGSAFYSLDNANVAVYSLLAFLLLFLIADLFIGDIYAMQKLLLSVVGVWTAYCLVMGLISQQYLKEFATTIYGDSFPLQLNLSSLAVAPIKIGFLGLIYWLSSVLIRTLYSRKLVSRRKLRRAV